MKIFSDQLNVFICYPFLSSCDSMWFPYALVSAIFYSLMWVFARMSRGIPVPVVVAAQFLFGPILLLAVLPHVSFPWSERLWWWYLFLAYLILPGTFWLLTSALHEMEVTVLKPIFGLSSIVALYLSVMFFDEVVTRWGVLGVLLITFGLFCLYHGRWSLWRKRELWIMLWSACIFGTMAVLTGALLMIFPHPIALVAVFMTGGFAFHVVPALYSLKQVSWTRRTVVLLSVFPFVVLGSDLSTVFGLLLGPSSYVIAVKRMSILLTAVIGYVFLHERGQSLRRLLVASGLVVVGVGMLTLG